jgi:hypothetical protein
MSEIFLPGTAVTLYAYFRISDSDPLINTDQPPTFDIQKEQPKGKWTTIFTTGSIPVLTGVYKAVWPTDNTINASLNYKIVWHAQISGNTVQGAEETFNFQQTSPVFTSTDPTVTHPYDVIISRQDLGLIKSVLAYPYSEEVLLTDCQISELVIYPALLEYFTKFPIAVKDQFFVGETIVIPFPDQFTFGVLDCRITGKFAQSSGRAPSFYSLILFNKYSPFSSGMYSSYSNKFRGYNPNGIRQSTLNYRQVFDSIGNQMSWSPIIDKVNRTVTIDANTSSYCDLTWSKYSNRFDSIPFERKMEVINLCQSNLIQTFVDSMQISQETSAEVQIGISEMQTRATELRERVISKWDQIFSATFATRVS